MLKTALLAAVWAGALSGAVTRVELGERLDVLGGKPFGSTGPYELITGKVFFAVDPGLEANRIIADIGLAPRNAAGLVEFASDLYVLKPRDPSKGNGTVLYEVSNRGRRGMLAMFNRASGTNDFGDGLLMEQGFTLVWLGWQFDVPDQPGLLRLFTPVVRDVTGIVRAEITLDRKQTVAPLADRDHIAYPVWSGGPAPVMTVRDRADGPRRPVPAEQWRLAGATHVEMPAGFDPGRIYEVVYYSKGAPVVGLGPAAVRDFISFLKYGGPETLLGDQRRFIKRSVGFGTSQSGRFLRTFLYYGFNSDEKKRKVFDGVWAHVAGGGRGSFNHRFAQPSRDGHPFFNTFYPTDIFPFTDLPEEDGGVTAGILSRAENDGVVPKVFYTNGSYEYWGRSASLIHTIPDGRQDAPLAAGTRVYFLAGTQHGANAAPNRAGTRNRANPMDYRWAMRGLVIAMQAWLADNREPPASRYPLASRDEFATPASLAFPKLSGVAAPTRPQLAWRADYGPEFATKGIVSIDPPKLGAPFGVRVPQVDSDGNETSGIRLPELAVPLATYTGWNLRDASIGAPEELFSMVGSFLPFPKTRAERIKTGDPRPSVEERYKGREDYLARVKAAAESLARERYLLDADVSGVVGQAGARWDALNTGR